MERRHRQKIRIVAWAALALASAPSQPAQAQTFRVLHTFTGGADGGTPEAPLLLRGTKLYGTTIGGGLSGNGVVFEFDLKTGRQTVLHDFAGSPSDGAYAAYAGLFADGAGDLYGVTAQGGSNGLGAVFELSPTGAEKLWSLAGRINGQDPQSAPVRDSSGTYSTAYASGPKGAGTVFKLGKAGSVSAIHGFNIRDGGGPTGAVVLIDGFLRGATYYGGVDQAGVIYKVNVATGEETVLYSFTGGADGGYPNGGLAADAAGNLYGTTSAGGISGNPNCPFNEAAVFRDLVYNAQKAAKSRLASLRRINLPAPAAYNLLRCQIANSRRRDFFPDRLAGARRPCSDAGCGRVRHRHTRYDELLMSGRERAAARGEVREEMDRVLDRWSKL